MCFRISFKRCKRLTSEVFIDVRKVKQLTLPLHQDLVGKQVGLGPLLDGGRRDSDRSGEAESGVDMKCVDTTVRIMIMNGNAWVHVFNSGARLA